MKSDLETFKKAQINSLNPQCFMSSKRLVIAGIITFLVGIFILFTVVLISPEFAITHLPKKYHIPHLETLLKRFRYCDLTVSLILSLEGLLFISCKYWFENFFLSNSKSHIKDLENSLVKKGSSTVICFISSVWFIIIIIVIFVFVAWLSLTPTHNWGGDFAAYIMQAQSLVKGTPGEFISSNTFTVKMSTQSVGPIAYPWGFPILLALCLAIFGLDLLAFKGLILICYLFFIIALWRGLGLSHSPLFRIILVCLFAFNPYLISFINNIVSDIPFLLLSTLSIILIGKLEIEKVQLSTKIVDRIILGLLIALSFFIRTNGILLLGILFLVQSIELVKKISFSRQQLNKKSKQNLWKSLIKRLQDNKTDFFIKLSPYLVFATTLILWRSFLPAGGSYDLFHEFQAFSLELFLIHVLYYFQLPSEFFSFSNYHLSCLIFVFSLPLAVIGMLKRFDTAYHMMLYCFFTFFLYLVWPSLQGLRFLFPLLPFYISFVISGLEAAATYDFKKKLNFRLVILATLSYCLVVAFFITSLKQSIDIFLLSDDQLKTDTPYSASSQDMFSFIKKNTNKKSVIVFFRPRVMRFFTNRPSLFIDIPRHLNRADYLCINIKKHILFSRNKISQLIKLDIFRPAYGNSNFKLYRINKNKIIIDSE